MAGDKADVLILAPKQAIVDGLEKAFTLHKLWEAKDREAFLDSSRRACAASPRWVGHAPVDAALMARLPKLEIVSSFGVGYDHVDAKWAGEHGIVVTNTPDVLTEEVADTALGLLLCTVREFPQAERYVRAGKWTKAYYPLTQGLVARPHRRHRRARPHRQGDRAAARRHERAGRLLRRGTGRPTSPIATTAISSRWRATSTCCSW